MKVTIWGTRGSIPSPSPENSFFGGNTACIQVTNDDTMIILDAGSGIRRLGEAIPKEVKKIDILLTHLHLDHIMGLGFFRPFYNPNIEVNIWGPRATIDSLGVRLKRYLSPPLFPVRLQDLPCKLNLMEIDHSEFTIGNLKINSQYVCHPGPTVGYRVDNGSKVVTYLPDHEPALGSYDFPNHKDWVSGLDLALNTDLLFHDAQYTSKEYKPRVGWGHSSIADAMSFGSVCKAKKLLLFHHDPSHSDEQLRKYLEEHLDEEDHGIDVGLAAEGDVIFLRDSA